MLSALSQSVKIIQTLDVMIGKCQSVLGNITSEDSNKFWIQKPKERFSLHIERMKSLRAETSSNFWDGTKVKIQKLETESNALITAVEKAKQSKSGGLDITFNPKK